MNKWKGSAGAKIAAWVLIVISSFTFMGSAIAAIACEEAGVYNSTQEEAVQSFYKTIAERYAYRAMQYRETEQDDADSNANYFEGTNFSYGILKTSDTALSEYDLNDEKSYEQRNFTDKVEKGDYWEYSFAITDSTTFTYGDSIWDINYYYQNDGDNEYNYIDKRVYEMQSGIFYYDCDGTYYPAKKIEIPVEKEDGSRIVLELTYSKKSQNYQAQVSYENYPTEETAADESYTIAEETTATDEVASTEEAIPDEQITADDSVDELVKDIIRKGNVSLNELDGTALGYENWTEVTLDGYTYDFRDSITPVYFSAGATSTSDEKYGVYSESYLSVASSEVVENYTVIALIPRGKLINEGNWSDGDLFVKAKIVMGNAYAARYVVFVIAALSLVVFLGGLIFLIQAAGHRKGTDEIVLTWMDKIPADVYAVLALLAGGFLLGVAIEVSYHLGESIFFVIIFIGLLLVLELFGIECLLSLAVRVKHGKWWQNTVIAKICSGIIRVIKKTLTAVPLAWKAVLIFVGISFLEFFFILVTQYALGAHLFLWFVEKILLALFLLKVVVELRKLQDAGRHIASGDAEYKVDTRRMFTDFKEHGENLNNIGDGITKAVDARMKSERFKTELITNVSHDIKTPLTSITNYVDLLEKEDLHNETAEEYLEVLDRQSARLKKLIEDLMEASKASTGNLSVTMELCEAGVFLVQTVGEFGERTEAADLDLIIQRPEVPVYIMADGRHFWRVIDNLMNNICKYAQPGTRVYINLETVNGSVTITFRNTSKYPLNISSEELMERFVRGDSSRNAEGNGLGLNIAQNLTELMKGRFELMVDGDLFKVVLTFPQVQGPVQQQEPTNPTPENL